MLICMYICGVFGTLGVNCAGIIGPAELLFKSRQIYALHQNQNENLKEL